MLVKKANGKLQTCIDYSDLNKACPKDSFPLSRIDQLVNGIVRHELLSFMDAYSGYNQIPMHVLEAHEFYNKFEIIMLSSDIVRS